jgi:hypothetical protein
VTLLHPVWLFLIIPLAVSLWLWPMPSRLLRVLRFVGLTLLLLALCGLALQLPSRAGTVVVVADRSQSMPPGSETQMKEVIDLIQGTMSAEDRLAVVSFGQAVAVEQRPQTEKFAGFVNEVGRDASNLAEAVETALSLIPTRSAATPPTWPRRSRRPCRSSRATRRARCSCCPTVGGPGATRQWWHRGQRPAAWASTTAICSARQPATWPSAASTPRPTSRRANRS